MSAMTKRKPLTAGTVKGAVVRPGRRISKHKHHHNTTKRRIRQIAWILNEYVRPITGFFLILMMFGFIGGTEREHIGMAAGMKLAYICLAAATLLLIPNMSFFKGGKGR